MSKSSKCLHTLTLLVAFVATALQAQAKHQLNTDATGINQPVADMSGAAYDLFTVDGVKVGSGFFSAEGNISTANLKSGVYVVKGTKNGKSQSMKISVNK